MGNKGIDNIRKLPENSVQIPEPDSWRGYLNPGLKWFRVSGSQFLTCVDLDLSQ